VPVPHARAAVWSLLVMMADITDPRDRRGVRHRLVAVLGVAVVATPAGAASYRELGSAAAGLPQELLSLLGARWDLAGLVFIAPCAGTLRRVLIALGAGELDRAVGRGCASTPAVTPAAGQSRWTARTCAAVGATTAGGCCSRR
jgi:hypothetical protein